MKNKEALLKMNKPQDENPMPQNPSGKYASLYCTLCRKENEKIQIKLVSGETVVGHLAAFDHLVFIVNTNDGAQVMITRTQIVTVSTLTKKIIINSTGDPAIFGKDVYMSKNE